MKRFLFSIALLFTALAGCSNHEGESAAPKSELNVMSYNIRYANASDKGDAAWDARKEASVAMIRDVKPDVIGMQEPRFSQAQYLIGELTEYEHYYLAPDDKDSQHRNAVWWRKDRFEMLAQGYFFLNEKDITQPIKGWGHNQFRTALWVKLRERSTGKEFFFFNTHLAHRASPVEGGDIDQVARTESVKLIVEQMKQIAGRYAPIFVTGDMNASYAAGDGRRTCLDGFFEFMWSARETAPDSEADDVYSYNNFGEGTPRFTWNIDHIFYRKVTPVGSAPSTTTATAFPTSRTTSRFSSRRNSDEHCMRGGSGRPARIKIPQHEKTAVYTSVLRRGCRRSGQRTRGAETALLQHPLHRRAGRRRRLRMGRPQGGFDPHDPRRAARTSSAFRNPAANRSPTSSNSCPNTATSKWDATSAPRTIPASI